MVYRLLSVGTMEERINNMLEEKRALQNLTVASGEGWLADMSNEELKDLVTLTG